ncbi:MAG: pyrroloquinoline quinone biosynthesis peptide chaperone PqqD [Gammaproteobacteria bacterium]
MPPGPLAIAPGYRFQFEPAQDAHVLLYPEGMIKLSQSAGAILAQVDGARSAGDIVDALKAQFPGADLEDDVRGFLTEALGKGWLRAAAD